MITDIQILILVICAALSLLAFKFRSPAIALIPSATLFYVGFQIFEDSQEPVIIILFFFTAITVFMLAFGRFRETR